MSDAHASRSAGSGAINPCTLSASELARLIAQGTITAREAVDAYIAQIERVNGALRAVVVKRYDEARAEADAIDHRRARGEILPPLAGVPITVKECLDLAGTASTFGLPGRVEMRAKTDDPYVGRLRTAGAIVVAKTNVAQLLIYTESDNPVYGRTNNPFNLERSCGGSSGGEGAILSVGASALGLGTDIGGSVRIPAAFCGISSLRPTAGRCPDVGRGSIAIGQRAVVSQVGPLGRFVEDLALALQLINGGHGIDTLANVPLGDFRKVDVAGLRVAVVTDDGVMAPSAAVARGVGEAAEILSAAGAQIIPWSALSGAEATELILGSFSADRGRGLRDLLRGGKVDPRVGQNLLLARLPHWLRRTIAALLSLVGQKRTAAIVRGFASGSAFDYWQITERVMEFEARFRDALERAKGGPIDLVLMPAYAVPAVRHKATINMPFAGSYALFSPLLGYPAGVVPVTCVRPDEETGRRKTFDVVERTAFETDRGSAGLPIGVQLMGRPWRDDVVLAAMHTIERAARQETDFPVAPKL
ncbi:MAG TPA: amidase family protein [Bradyrhizobium sp.]|nr:amidase family protein [Bradyrhizobium sp.]